MTDISMDTTICRTKDVVASDIDGEVVMMSIENGAYYGIDSIGSRIWELIETPCKVSELIEKLLEEFEVDRPTCEKDVLKFLEELQKDKIILVQPG